MAPVVAPPPSLGPSKQKRKFSDMDIVTSIASSQGPKSSPSYSTLLYRLGIFEGSGQGTIPPDSGKNKILQYFPEPKNISLIADLLTTWFLKFEPNEATLVQTICHHVFPWKLEIPNESCISLLFEFLGPFRAHNLHELRKGDGAIKYPLIKRDASREKSQNLQTPAQDDLRSRSDFVFAASIMILDSTTRDCVTEATSPEFRIPCISNDLRSCAVAIIAEAKAIASTGSNALAKIQWSSLSYMQIMDRISIAREATYADDENICQYGYLIRGLSVSVWKMSLRLNIAERRESDVLDEYFSFPIQRLGHFNIGQAESLEKFVTLHKNILSWWINEYIPSFIKDLTNIVSANPFTPPRWKSSWQQELKKCGCLVNHLLDCMLTLVQDSPRSTVLEKQVISKDVGAENNGVASHPSPGQNDPITSEEQPTSKDSGAENDGVPSQQSLGQNDPITSEEQPTSKDAGAEKDGVPSQQSLGENDPIASEEQPSGKDVGAENDGSGHDGKSTVKSTLKSSAYLIFFRALPGIHPSQTAMPKKSKDWQVLPRTWGGEAHT